MKTKIKKVICVALAALFMFAFAMTVTGCGEKEPEYPEYEPPKNCDVVLEDGVSIEEHCEKFIIICDTYEELLEEFLRRGIEMFEESAVIVRKYADEHAEDKSFVVCFYIEGSYNGEQHVREVEVKDGKLTMYIWHERLGYGLDVVTSWFHIVGVDKSFVANVTECEYVFV